MTRGIFALALLPLAACAASPDAIAPAAAPPGLYDGMTCTAARAAQAQIAADLTRLSAQQRDVVTGDALSVFLVAVPLSKVTGADKAGLIADAKGRALAVEARLARC